ncbi:MAG TPA: hypothetical protein VGH23_01620 [Rhizomicrobium sp.]|jgi:hypothetical protein
MRLRGGALAIVARYVSDFLTNVSLHDLSSPDIPRPTDKTRGSDFSFRKCELPNAFSLKSLPNFPPIDLAAPSLRVQPLGILRTLIDLDILEDLRCGEMRKCQIS